MAYPTGELYVDLRAIAENWNYMKRQLPSSSICGAVVKANAYGLGVERVAPKVYQAGCRDFFVANLKEALQLKSLVGLDASIYVLTGCIAGAEQVFIERNLTPVIVSLEMLYRWRDACAKFGVSDAVLKVNSGMGRMGLEPEEFTSVCANPDWVLQSGVTMLMSHLACAEVVDHSLNSLQFQRFKGMLQSLRKIIPDVRASLANSAGVFLGEEYCFDVVRPGIALYGGNPTGDENPMQPVVGLNLPVIQVRDLPAGECVGYGATKKFNEPRKIAVVAGGYADGVFRSLGSHGCGWIGGVKVPIVGRVSMDSTLFDVTDVPEGDQVKAGGAIELLGEHVGIDELAESAGTISYEMLTSFGGRYQRCYVG